jgi:hypothetical protein
MRQSWTDPFSVELAFRRIGWTLLVGTLGVGGVIGLPLLKYQSLKSQLQSVPPPLPRGADQTTRLAEKLGGSGAVTATRNGWVIRGKDPDSWVRLMSTAPPEMPLSEILLVLVQDEYVLTLRVSKGLEDVVAQ